MRKCMSFICPVICLTVILGFNLPALSQTWTETFENGVGHLSETLCNGDDVFVYDASTQSIDATFIRYTVTNPANDKRFALLEGGPFDFATAVTKFIVVVTPLSWASGSANAAHIGLFVTGEECVGNTIAVISFRMPDQVIRLRYSNIGSDQTIPFVFGETYFVEATLDGPALHFHLDAYLGVDSSGTWLGKIDHALPPEIVKVLTLNFDGFGLVSTPTGSELSEVRARIHELSLLEIAQPIEWSVLDGGNGHFYEFVEAPLITWADASIAVANREYQGMPGHLLTSTSVSENNFVRDTFSNGTGMFGWIGASDSAVEGEWRWVEGPESGIQFWQGGIDGTVTPPFNFANWAGRDPTGGSEDFAVMGLGPFDVVQAGEWGDADNNAGSGAPIAGYFVEYSGPDCDGDGIPNDRNPDCNANGVPDECDITFETSSDFNLNDIPDECEPDCQPNDIPDFIEIGLGLSEDCNLDDVPDDCQIDENDCNTNEIPDDCESNSDDDKHIDDCDNCIDVNNPMQADFDIDGMGDACDPDIDNDGVDNELDVCNFTFIGAAVDSEGRSLGDLDLDCDTDLDDYRLFQSGFTGTGADIP